MYKKIYEKLKKIIREYIIDIIIIAVFATLAYLPLPYVITGTGGVDNLSKRVIISDSYKSKGSINAAYVSEYNGTPLTLLYAKIKGYTIEKEEEFLYDNETMEDDYHRNRILFDISITDSIYNAYKRANVDIKIKSIDKYVVYKLEEADTDIKIGDMIISINGIDVTKMNNYDEVLKNSKEGDKVEVKVIYDSKEYTRYAKLFKYDDRLLLGISLAHSYNFKSSKTYTIKSYKGLGPSGGLMTSLYIYNQLIKEDLTNGLKIAGTGTIDIDGNVGAIGGVGYKIRGAKKAKVDVFFVPSSNYDEALKTYKKYDCKFKLVKVDTLDEAISYLSNIK